MSETEIESPHPRHIVKDWYPPEEVIQYRQEHVLWLLRHIQDLRADYYPEGNASVKSAGEYIVSPVLLYLELTTRLRQCGLDGLILLVRESLNMLEVELGDYLNQSASEVIKAMQTALLYISGEKRKWENREGQNPITYQEFKHLVKENSKISEN